MNFVLIIPSRCIFCGTSDPTGTDSTETWRPDVLLGNSMENEEKIIGKPLKIIANKWNANMKYIPG